MATGGNRMTAILNIIMLLAIGNGIRFSHILSYTKYTTSIQGFPPRPTISQSKDYPSIGALANILKSSIDRKEFWSHTGCK